MGWLIALGILVLLASIPLGAEARYSAEGFLVRVIVGPVKLKIYPRPEKERKREEKIEEPAKAAPVSEKKPDPKPAHAGQKPQTQQPKEEEAEKGGSIADFLPFVKLGVELLGAFRRKLRVNRLELKLTMAADDPCDLAVNYGKAWAAVGNLIPQLERLFVIKKRDVEVQCDFTASETVVYARLDLTITLGRLLSLAAVYGVRALKEFLTIRKKRKGGAVK